MEANMIIEVSGDILNSKAQAIAHGVAPDDHFNQGLALSLREMWPSMAKDFRHYCKTSHPQSGEAWVWMGSDGKKIINLMTQEAAPNEHSNPGKASIRNLHHALKELRKVIEREKLLTVAIPKIATGVGGLSWSEVKEVIYKDLADVGAKIYLYTNYKKGESANEN